MSLGWIWVVTWPSLRKIVARPAPFHTITDWGAKPLPFTVKVKPGSPALAVGGERDVMLGEGLFTTPPHDDRTSATASRINADSRAPNFNALLLLRDRGMNFAASSLTPRRDY